MLDMNMHSNFKLTTASEKDKFLPYEFTYTEYLKSWYALFLIFLILNPMTKHFSMKLIFQSFY